jgi:amidophosphoribosyltransferase
MDQIREYLGADSIGYLDTEAMVRATGQPASNFCMACFNGDYPVPVDPRLDKYIMERRSNRTGLLTAENEEPRLFEVLK